MNRKPKKLLSITALLLVVILSANILASCKKDSPATTNPDEKLKVEETMDFSDSDIWYQTKDKGNISYTASSAEINFAASETQGLVSYSISSNKTVLFDTAVDNYGITDSISINDTLAFEKQYFQGDMYLDSIYADYYEVEIDYDTAKRISCVYYYDCYYDYIYLSEAGTQIKEVLKNGSAFIEYEYYPNGLLKSETINGVATTYAYNNGELSTINEVSNSNYDTAFESAISRRYGYSYENKLLLTQKTVGLTTTNYLYLNDKVVSLATSSYELLYILDADLNHLGLYYNDDTYYFAYDALGRIIGLLDNEGSFQVVYEYDALGNVSVTGELATTLGRYNEVLSVGLLYDFTYNVYFASNEEVYLPSNGLYISSGKIRASNPFAYIEQVNYERSPIVKFATLHDKVVEVAAANLRDNGLDVVTNLYGTDRNGLVKRAIDIWTVDYSLTPFSAMNLFNGNTIYEVAYKPIGDDAKWKEKAQNKLSEIAAKQSGDRDIQVSYFADYNPAVGGMKFSGQFIFFGCLIDYKCIGDGVIEYRVLKNNPDVYDTSINIYDYDKNIYIQYVNNTFDLDFIEGIRIIPGTYQEKKAAFEAVDNYLGEMQFTAGLVVDQMLIYDDPTYVSSVEGNTAIDYWAQLNIPDNQVLKLANGMVDIEILPTALDAKSLWTKIAIGAGVILVTAIAATIVVAIPGAGCTLVGAIIIGAAKGAALGAVSGFAFGAVMGGVGSIASDIISGNNIDWEKAFDSALTSGVDGFMTGAITGAIMGGINGALKPTACFVKDTTVATAAGLVAIQTIKAGDQVWSYNAKTGVNELKTVLSTSIKKANNLVSITAGGETIKSTPEHPYYVVGQGYTAATLLKAGDILQRLNGENVVVEQIQHEIFELPIDVFNFEVEDNHSYFIGNKALVVHNLGCGNSPKDLGFSRADYLENATDPKLRSSIEKLYRPGAVIGDGGTADAIRWTKMTGELVGGSDHIQKGLDQLSRLNRLLIRGGLNPTDTAIATSLADDLLNALRFVGRG